MALTPISNSVEFVQDSVPTTAADGDSWLDTSQSPPQLKVFDSSANAFVRPRSIQNLNAPVSNAGATQSDIANGVDSSNLSDEITSGRTRELLLLLQDKTIPEVQDPINVSSSVSVKTSSGDYLIQNLSRNFGVDKFNGGVGPNNGFVGPTFNFNAGGDLLSDMSISVSTSHNNAGGNLTKRLLYNGSQKDSTTGTFGGGLSATISRGNVTTNFSISVEVDTDDASVTVVLDLDGSATADVGSGFVTDKFTARTTEPADFKQWNVIQARDVTTGGSTSPEPVEFEILDSSDAVLNSTRIPKARIADEAFTMRNRVYSEDAGSDGQSDYQIATTGNGGHFGFPILTVVSVKKNGSVLDSANWSFDGDTTVTIDTSNVSIASGDTIDIKYDFDVFDSTLQPRAYLSRESESENSPSISHFRYEYVI